MASGVRKTGICYHGTQVAVSGIISEIIWDWLLNDFDPKKVELDKCYPSFEEMEPRVKAARLTGWTIPTMPLTSAGQTIQKKLQRWHDHKAEFKAFLDNFDEFKKAVAPWVKKPEYIADCMHKGKCAHQIFKAQLPRGRKDRSLGDHQLPPDAQPLLGHRPAALHRLLDRRIRAEAHRARRGDGRRLMSYAPECFLAGAMNTRDLGGIRAAGRQNGGKAKTHQIRRTLKGD